ncbi:hypothetical protein HEQ65_00105 [Haematospirillum sp. H4890]|nr:hypothetical protein [Haematospirillum sp. H4890]
MEKNARVAVEPVDTILVHGSIRRTLADFRRAGFAVDPGDILQSFLDAVGARGTLLLPLFLRPGFPLTSGIPRQK